MLNPIQGPTTDRRATIAIVPWDSGFRAWDPVESPSGETWHPQGGRAITLTADQAEPAALIQHLSNRSLSALLLVGRSSSSGAVEIQTRAENRIPRTHERADPLAAGVVRATLATAEILRDLDRAGLRARAVSEAENDAGSHLLFRILAGLPDTLATPPVGLIRLPRDMAPNQVNQAIRTVASAVCRHLPSLAPTA